ncbi:CBS domain-containing protein [Methanohalobium sp.]|uniref:CBS domain-containing protein n=1 Tax=Methanohalobium sp. TaxID=2837493 RepID=UPI0025F8D4D7|nr:CBS domain-containing protein [Methanohalobium sp.]
MIFPTAENLKRKRNELGFTQNELAKMTGVSQPLIARIESNDVDPRLSTVKKIYDAFQKAENKNFLAKNIMHTDVVYISPDKTINDAVNIMEKHGYSQIPVFEDWSCVGSVSEDMILKVMTDNKINAISEMKIRDVMMSPLPVISPETFINAVFNMFEQFSAVLIMDDGKYTGIITKHDLMKLLHS